MDPFCSGVALTTAQDEGPVQTEGLGSGCNWTTSTLRSQIFSQVWTPEQNGSIVTEPEPEPEWSAIRPGLSETESSYGSINY